MGRSFTGWRDMTFAPCWTPAVLVGPEAVGVWLELGRGTYKAWGTGVLDTQEVAL